jgi:hypothetical protein
MATSQNTEKKSRIVTEVTERFVSASELADLFKLLEAATSSLRSFNEVRLSALKGVQVGSPQYSAIMQMSELATAKNMVEVDDAKKNIAQEIRRAIMLVDADTLKKIAAMPTIAAFFKAEEVKSAGPELKDAK